MRWKAMYILAVAAVLAGVVIPANASSGKGEIRVTVDYEDDEVHNASVTLYQVAQRCGNDYTLTDYFGGGIIRAEDAMSAALAAWLSESARTEGIPRILDADGSACFTGLPEGLYLLKQSEREQDQQPFAPFLIAIPSNGVWEVGVYPQTGTIYTESPKTGQHPAPIIGAMGLILSTMALGMCFDRFRRK